MGTGAIDSAAGASAALDVESASVAAVKQVMNEQQMEGQLLLELLPPPPSGNGSGSHVDRYA